ncbi:glycoside hydrolase family 108 protein [Kushneria indalinina]|uniref:Putative peptidoglycan binding protein n=1 Tax=Kushneria indalinina DSM 14324 TaxID=1122140 RepID=A0A3D9DVV3_9GAMM|nr:glycosyl hydrolase 108 family protein [Kushneria indalinina]REC94876.1 putative peptidoglycan binding protein [Kushneria indalinina DSM 14324]
MTFEKAFERLIGHEGGYVNHPDDPGGATKWGITQRTAREAGYHGDMRDLTRDRAREIYLTGYWLRAKCDQYHGAIGYQLFDIAVNSGIGNAIRMLQRAAGVADDGIIGPVTLAAINAHDPLALIVLLNAERQAFYTRLSTWETFGKGWSRRVAENLRYAVGDT